MKALQQPNTMGSNNESMSLPPISLPPIQKRPSSQSRDLSKRSQSRLSQHNDHHPDSLIATVVNGHRTQFTLAHKGQELIIKCVNIKTSKKFITHYKYELLPKAIQVTYKSLEELFEEIKYIVDESVSNRLAIGEDGKLVFSLETKKKGKTEFLAEVFELQEESEEKTMSRLEEQIQKLKEEDQFKTNKIHQMEQRLTQLQQLFKASLYNRQNRENQTHYQQRQNQQQAVQNFSAMQSPMSTIQVNASSERQHNNLSQMSIDHSANQSIIKKFKKTKSTQSLELKHWQQGQIQPPSANTLLKTTINHHDCFFELSNDCLNLELLSRKQAKIYKTLITPQSIPKSVYSFVPTPKHLYDQIAFIINKNIPNRLDVLDTSFVYRASINTKDQEVLIDGVFPTLPVEQNDLERIEDLVDIRTSHLQLSVKQLKIQMQLLKLNLSSNDIILEQPEGFMDSKIVNTPSLFITLCRFFKSKIFKISLLYRASQHNFQVKKFHDKCDGIPNTLTLVVTEFNKIIGGFTSEQWDKNGNGKSISDYQSHSFIFSLTNRHKFSLQQHEHAIQTSSEDGPRFGNGADLVIKDRANENNNSYANICTSYTHPRYVYKNGESYKYFSGDDKTNRFGVKEWEVFEVFFEE